MGHKRPLPWRTTRDPYRIWISEVILQQTRVGQGRRYYLQFTQRWPTVQDLASAHQDQVLKMWQGLGYYSRARHLLKAAQQVMDEHGGQFPDTYAGLITLKGVGDYTASAVASICFQRPEAVVDGNVYRVLSRFRGIDTPIDSTAGRKQFKALATELLDPGHPGEHNQAVMELGATLCTPRNPACERCPLQARCVAFATGKQAELPVKQGRTKVRHRHFNYLLITAPHGIYMQQRGAGDIWQGLYEPPLLESRTALARSAMARLLEKEHGAGWELGERTERPPHVLSHQVIHAVFWAVEPARAFAVPGTWRRAGWDTLGDLAVPRLIEAWMGDHLGLDGSAAGSSGRMDRKAG